MKRNFCTFFTLTPLACILTLSVAPAEVVPVWTYHATPPFVVDEQKKTGLSYDLAKLLTERSEGKYDFYVEVLPRVRLDERLLSGDPGIVFWANAVWFGDKDKSQYLWSSAIMQGRNVVISPISNPLEYDNAYSLIGKDFVGVRGHHYQYVDALVEQGKINRMDVISQQAALLSIASGHTEVSILANYTAIYYAEKLGLGDKIHFSSRSHTHYKRHILVQPQLRAVFGFVEKFATESTGNAQWQTLLENYRIELD